MKAHAKTQRRKGYASYCQPVTKPAFRDVEDCEYISLFTFHFSQIGYFIACGKFKMSTGCGLSNTEAGSWSNTAISVWLFCPRLAEIMIFPYCFQSCQGGVKPGFSSLSFLYYSHFSTI